MVDGSSVLLGGQSDVSLSLYPETLGTDRISSDYIQHCCFVFLTALHYILTPLRLLHNQVNKHDRLCAGTVTTASACMKKPQTDGVYGSGASA
jgi:hypothetical protein